MDVTIKTQYESKSGTLESRNVTLWLNRDNTVSLLGNIPHGHTIIVDQELVNKLQELVNQIAKNEESK